MITGNQLTSIGFRHLGRGSYYYGDYDFMYKTDKQELLWFDDFMENYLTIGKITDIDYLETIVVSLSLPNQHQQTSLNDTSEQ